MVDNIFHRSIPNKFWVLFVWYIFRCGRADPPKQKELHIFWSKEAAESRALKLSCEQGVERVWLLSADSYLEKYGDSYVWSNIQTSNTGFDSVSKLTGPSANKDMQGGKMQSGSPTIDDNITKFLDDIAYVCRKHKMSISHQDCHGAFIIESYKPENIDWLREAERSVKYECGGE